MWCFWVGESWRARRATRDGASPQGPNTEKVNLSFIKSLTLITLQFWLGELIMADAHWAVVLHEAPANSRKKFVARVERRAPGASASVGPDDVCVQISHAALNHRDLWITKGLYPRITPGSILGSDGVGIVQQAGEHVRALLGKRVVLAPCSAWGSDERGQDEAAFAIRGLLPELGALQSRVALPAYSVALAPEHLTDAQAAALPLAGLTAWRAVSTKAEVCTRQTILVTGVGGGVASMAVLFAVALGARVFVTSSQRSKIDWACAQLGALGGVLYTDADWTKQLAVLAGGARMFDAAIDGSGAGLDLIVTRVLRSGARLVCYGATSGPGKELPLVWLFLRNIELRGTTMGSPREFEDMLRFVSRHCIVPPVDCVLPVHRIGDALERMEAGGQCGKLVLSLAGESPSAL